MANMVYNNDSHITSVKDVEAFFHHIVFERKVNFHPDDMFEDYVNCEGGINTFTLDECAIYNRLMDESFKVCAKERVDIYSIGLTELQTALGILICLWLFIIYSTCQYRTLEKRLNLNVSS